MKLSERQKAIIEIVKKAKGPITGKQIAEELSLARGTLRPDLTILTKTGLLESRTKVGYFYNEELDGQELSARYVYGEDLYRIPVGEVQSVPVVVTEKCTVYDAVVTMFTEDVGTMFVVREGGFLEGVLSRKDLLRSTLGQDTNLPVGVIMTRMPKVVYVEESTPVWEAANKLITHEVDALPVIRLTAGKSGQEELEVVGRFSKTNVTKLFVELGKTY